MGPKITGPGSSDVGAVLSGDRPAHPVFSAELSPWLASKKSRSPTNHTTFLRCAALIGDAGGSAVSKQGYMVILRRRTGKATRRQTYKMKVESDVLIYFHYEDMKRKFSDSAR
jgi:hypothetical protein